MTALEGSCKTAIGAYGRIEAGTLNLTVEAQTPDGKQRFRREGSIGDLTIEAGRALGLKLGLEVLAEGGDALQVED
jgi:hydroxymethylbilane synthase